MHLVKDQKVHSTFIFGSELQNLIDHLKMQIAHTSGIVFCSRGPPKQKGLYSREINVSLFWKIAFIQEPLSLKRTLTACSKAQL